MYTSYSLYILAFDKKDYYLTTYNIAFLMTGKQLMSRQTDRPLDRRFIQNENDVIDRPEPPEPFS